MPIDRKFEMSSLQHRRHVLNVSFSRDPDALSEASNGGNSRPELQGGPSLGDTRLATLPFLSAEDATLVRNCGASRRVVRTGTELCREGDFTDNLHFIEDGWACQYAITRDGRRQISAVLLPGDVCNLDALLFKRLTLGVRMLTAGTVISVPRDRVAALVAEAPGVARCVNWLAFVENAIISRRVLCLGRLSARERLAHLFCELAVRLGFERSQGEISFDMPLTQEHLADVLGLTPVHLNRTIQLLRSEKLLTLTRRTILIYDVAALRGVGEFETSYLRLAELQDAKGGATFAPPALAGVR